MTLGRPTPRKLPPPAESEAAEAASAEVVAAAKRLTLRCAELGLDVAADAAPPGSPLSVRIRAAFDAAQTRDGAPGRHRGLRRRDAAASAVAAAHQPPVTHALAAAAATAAATGGATGKHRR
jgi:hypothetical protein